MKDKSPPFRDAIKLAFLISFLYWIYLILTTRMIIAWDAISYESLGNMLAQKGWLEFFRTGPNREPFYPALVSLSIGLGKIFGLYYQFIQVLLQLLILFLTQILTLRILRLLKVNNLLSALTILYLGISPAIVNSALSLYSEIATYPLTLAATLLIYKSWLSFTGPRIHVILMAIATGLLFVSMTLSKAIFELVTPVFLFLFMVSALSTRNRRLIVNLLAYLVVFLAVFYSSVGCYKAVNKALNGCSVVRDRGAWVLYVAANQRMEPLSCERFLTALAYIPGEGVCKSIFGEEKCRFWALMNGDRLALPKFNELTNSNMPPATIHSTLISLSKQKILQNPCQYLLLTLVEGLKMFFWESTQIGYVEYPVGLTRLFAWTPFKNLLRLGTSFLSLLASAYLTVFLWRKRKNVLKKESSLLFPYLSILFIFSFISCSSIFVVITRYAFPIVPLYLIIIAYVLQRICFRSQTV